MNKKNWYILLIVIFLTVIVLGFVLGCMSKQVLNYTVEKDMLGVYKPLKLEVTKYQVRRINRKLNKAGCESLVYREGEVYIYLYDYYCAEELFKNGLIPNRVIKKAKQTKFLKYEFE